MEVKKNPLNRISLSIGSSLDMQEMIDNFLMACKEDLDCDLVALFACRESPRSFQNISCHPRNESSLVTISDIISLLGDLEDFDSDTRVNGMYYCQEGTRKLSCFFEKTFLGLPHHFLVFVFPDV